VKEVAENRKKGIYVSPKKVKKEEEFYWQLSQKSIKIEEIKGVIFGGLSSRFWSFRKQLNLIDMTY